MTDTVLFEQQCGSDVLRLIVQDFKGVRFASLRKWYPHGDELRPGKQGCSIPLSLLLPIAEAINGYPGIEPPETGKASRNGS